MDDELNIPKPSTWQVWRRRLAPLVLVFACFVLYRESCSAADKTPVTVTISAKAVDSLASQLSGSVAVEGHEVANFSRQAQAGSLGAAKVELPLPSGAATVTITLIASGRLLEFTRKLEAKRGSSVTIDIGDEASRRLQR